MIFFIPDSSADSNKNGRILKKIRKKTTFAPCRDYEITISRYIDKIGGAAIEKNSRSAEQKKAPADRGWKVDQA